MAFHGFGAVAATSGSAPWVAGTALARASWNIVDRLSISLDVGIAIPFVRETAVLSGATPAITLMNPPTSTGGTVNPPPVAGRILLGPELRF